MHTLIAKSYKDYSFLTTSCFPASLPIVNSDRFQHTRKWNTSKRRLYFHTNISPVYPTPRWAHKTEIFLLNVSRTHSFIRWNSVALFWHFLLLCVMCVCGCVRLSKTKIIKIFIIRRSSSEWTWCTICTIWYKRTQEKKKKETFMNS